MKQPAETAGRHAINGWKQAVIVAADAADAVYW